MAGYNQDVLKEYVPALVYTMYDGYYIYSAFTNTLSSEDYSEDSTYQNGEKISGLKPYIHYSCRYKQGNIDVVITYSLDNFITVQGIDKNGNGINDSGYLVGGDITVVQKDASGTPMKVKYRGIEIEPEDLSQEYIGPNNNPDNLYQYIKVNGAKYYKYKPEIDGKTGWFTIINGEKYGSQANFNSNKDYNAVEYYAEAKEFMDRLSGYGILDLKTSNAVDEKGNSLDSKFGTSKIFDYSNIEEPNSNFNQHRLAVIRYSIEKNLSIAIANYNNYVGQSKANFQMPELKEDEWDKILNNVSIISFLQGLNIGGKVYNGYSIITNTKNKEVVSENSIYIVDNDNYYNAKCKDLAEKSITRGVLNIDFERVSRTNENGTTENYYPKTQLADYSSVVTQTNVDDAENIYEYMDNLNKKSDERC